MSAQIEIQNAKRTSVYKNFFKKLGQGAAFIILWPVSWLVSTPKIFRTFRDKDFKFKTSIGFHLTPHRELIILDPHNNHLDEGGDGCCGNNAPQTPEEIKGIQEASRTDAIALEHLAINRYRLPLPYLLQCRATWMFQPFFLAMSFMGYLISSSFPRFDITSAIIIPFSVDLGLMCLGNLLNASNAFTDKKSDMEEMLKFMLYHISNVFSLKKCAGRIFPFIREYENFFQLCSYKALDESSSNSVVTLLFSQPSIPKPLFLNELNKSFEFRLKDILKDFIPGDGFKKHGPREIIYSYMGMSIALVGPSKTLYSSFIDPDKNAKEQKRIAEHLLMDLEQERKSRIESGTLTLISEDNYKKRIGHLMQKLALERSQQDITELQEQDMTQMEQHVQGRDVPIQDDFIVNIDLVAEDPEADQGTGIGLPLLRNFA